MAFTIPQIIAIALAFCALTAVAIRRICDRGLRRYARHAAIAGLNANDGLTVQDIKGRILWANDAYCDMMGYAREDILGRNPLSFCLPEDERPTDEEIAAFRYLPDNELFERLGNTNRTVHRNCHSSGRLFWNQITISYHRSMQDGPLAVLVCRDVTEDVELRDALRKKTEEFEHLANHDSLTGAANRSYLLDRVRQLRAESEDVNSDLAILHIDLDKFKQLNDRFGHAAGDAALVHVTRATKSVLRSEDLLARIGGDEFAIACRGIKDEAGLLAIADKIRSAIRSPFDWEGHEIVCHASVGGTFCQGPGDTLDKMLGRADLALYEVKRSGRAASALYDPKLAASTAQHNRWTDALRTSITGDGLDYRFQPVIDPVSGDIHSFEALPFWRQPDGTFLAPAKLLAQAKYLGLRWLIDEQNARASCELQRSLAQHGFASIPVSFAVCSDGHVDLEAAQALATLPQTLGADPVQLLAEIDAARLNQADGLMNRPDGLGLLRDAGFGIVARNFCGGFIGLESTCGAALAAIKIDTTRAGLTRKGELATTILRAALDVGAALGHPMIVVGVDTEDEAELITSLSPPYLQGTHLAAPLAARQVLPWLLDRSSAIAPQPQHSY